MAQIAPPRPPAAYSRQQLQHAAAADAQKYGVGPWFVNQINQESGFNPEARSGAGAEGIAQFMPGTAKSVGLSDPYNPIASLDAAARFDAKLLKEYGTPQRALSAYNSGRPDAYQDPNFAGGQTYHYVRSILGASSPKMPAASPSAGKPALVAAAAAPAAAPTLPDFRAALAQQLAHAAGTPTNDLSSFYSTLHQALQARQAAASTPPPAHTATPRATGLAADPQASTIPAGAGRGRVLGDTTGEQPGFLNSLAELAAFEHAPVDLNSGYRSEAEQARLYANRASNPNPVAPPGHSLHEQGLAGDGTVGGVPLGRLPAAVLKRFGLATVPGDPVHVQILR